VRDRLAARRKTADRLASSIAPEEEPEQAPFDAAPEQNPDAQHRASDAGSDQNPYPDEYARHDARPHDRASAKSAYAAHSEAYEVDLRRLEQDLEALQRDGHEEPLARAAAEGGLRREAQQDAGREPSIHEVSSRAQPPARDTYIDGLRLPRSLEASYLPPPPMRDRTNHLGAVLRVLIACIVAAPVTYFLVYYFSTVREGLPTDRGQKLETVETQIAALPPMPASQPRDGAASAQVQTPRPQALQPPVPPEQAPVQAAPQRSGSFTLQSAAPNWPAAGETRALAPEPVKPRIRLDPDEIAVLLKQGEQFIAAGDVVTARVPFERAAEAGDARAALALGATYDPMVLARLGVRGIAGDVAKARTWYERAKALGSAEAAGRLANLTSR
jgi:hypothetical protein